MGARNRSDGAAAKSNKHSSKAGSNKNGSSNSSSQKGTAKKLANKKGQSNTRVSNQFENANAKRQKTDAEGDSNSSNGSNKHSSGSNKNKHQEKGRGVNNSNKQRNNGAAVVSRNRINDDVEDQSHNDDVLLASLQDDDLSFFDNNRASNTFARNTSLSGAKNSGSSNSNGSSAEERKAANKQQQQQQQVINKRTNIHKPKQRGNGDDDDDNAHDDHYGHGYATTGRDSTAAAAAQPQQGKSNSKSNHNSNKDGINVIENYEDIHRAFAVPVVNTRLPRKTDSGVWMQPAQSELLPSVTAAAKAAARGSSNSGSEMEDEIDEATAAAMDSRYNNRSDNDNNSRNNKRNKNNNNDQYSKSSNNSDNSDNEVYDSEASDNDDDDIELAPLSARQLQQQQQLLIHSTKVKIAEICEQIVSNPEQHIRKVAVLLEMLNISHADLLTQQQQSAERRSSKQRKQNTSSGGSNNAQVQQLVMLSLVELFRDILPSYRIKLHGTAAATGGNKHEKVSKEVETLRKHESLLLLYYSQYIKLLITQISTHVKAASRQHSQQQHSLVVVQCLCAVLQSHYSFNYRQDLLYTAVPLLNHSNEAVRSVVMTTLTQVFNRDLRVSGDCTYEIVKIISTYMKKASSSSSSKIRPDMIHCLSKIALRDSVLSYSGTGDDSEQQKSKKYSGKKQKYTPLVTVNEQELKQQTEMSTATVDTNTRKRYQISILSSVMTVLFRVLKSYDTKQSVVLLPAVLQCINRFVYHINIELVLDVIGCIKEIIASYTQHNMLSMEDRDEDDNSSSNSSNSRTHLLSIESILSCIHTVFAVLHAQTTSVITIDLHSFYLHTYNLLYVFCDYSNEAHLPVLLQILHHMFIVSKQIALQRVAAFVKRLSIVSLYVSPYCSLAIVHFIHTLAVKYPALKSMYDGDDSVSTVSSNNNSNTENEHSGRNGNIVMVGSISAYLPYVTDPDYSNASSSTLWELMPLSTSQSCYHSVLQQYTHDLISDKAMPMNRTRVSAEQLLAQYNSSTGGFLPVMQEPSTHSVSLIASVNETSSNTQIKKAKMQQRRQKRELAAQLQQSSVHNSKWSEFLTECVTATATATATAESESVSADGVAVVDMKASVSHPSPQLALLKATSLKLRQWITVGKQMRNKRKQ